MSNRKEIYIGRLTNTGYSKNSLKVTLEIELKDKDNKGKVLSISGNVWNNLKTDCYMCGQINDTLRTAINKRELIKLQYPKTTITKLLDIWDTWHLNDMNAGCEHQRAAKWDEIKLDDSKPLTQNNMATWKNKKDHPKGLLSEPCPICGYKYGTAWLFEKLPDEVINFITDNFLEV